MTIDLILPIYKPDKVFLDLVEEMTSQSLPINKIIIMNTEQKYFDRLTYSTKFLDKYENIEIRHLSKREYDHGKTRNAAVKLSDADYFIMMSQNAMPVGKEIIAKLLKALEAEPNVAVAYAGEVSVASAKEYDKFERRYFFPEDSAVRSMKDVDTLGWMAYMNSNNCAMYRRDIFDKLGGFLNHVICNEDILFASKAINEGYKVSYVADAIVVCTAEIEEKDRIKEAFDMGVSVAKHPEVFDAEAFKSAFHKLDKLTLNHLRRTGHRNEIFAFKRIMSAHRKGFGRGLKYRKIPGSDVARFSYNTEYWRVDEILRDRNFVDVHSGYGRSEEELKMIAKTPVPNQRKEETE